MGRSYVSEFPLSLLMLDIDGVLNDHRKFANGYSPILAKSVERLNYLLAEVPEAQIVLISSWRYTFDHAKLVETLLMVHGVDCFNRVHGVTVSDEEIHGLPIRVHGVTVSDEEIHGLPMPPWEEKERWETLGRAWRVEQIGRYVASAGVGDRYVAIDDLPLDIPAQHFVKTHPNVGLTLHNAITAASLLRSFR